MIGYLKGKIIRTAPGPVLLDVGGVGYEVHVAMSAADLAEGAARGFPFGVHADPGESVALWIHTHVRETEIVLYGFKTEVARRLYRLLITVSGVGPKMAMAVLADIPAGELVTALAGGDVQRLQGVSGVGKKTAERMVAALRDKVVGLHGAAASWGGQVADDVVAGLVRLGYTPADAQASVTSVAADLRQSEAAAPGLAVFSSGFLGMPEAELMRLALARLGGSA